MELEIMPGEVPRTGPLDQDAVISGLWREHALRLMRLAFVLMGDRESTEDVVQEAFLGLHRRFHTLRDRDGAVPYLRRSVVNGSRSVLRRRRLPGFFAKTYEPPAWSAESEALMSGERQAVLAEVYRLPRRQREALLLRYYAGLSEEETARAMGVSGGTVKSTSSRGLDALARALEEDDR